MWPLQLLLLFLNKILYYFLQRGVIIILILFFATTQGLAFTTNHLFSTRLVVSGDTDPPSIPAPLTATPVATDQIDLLWGASVDAIAVGGYRVFRDAIQIATTTLTTFSDVGLVASSTYSYYVDAFDIFANYSSSSVTVATTTWAIPIVSEDPIATTTNNDMVGSVSIMAGVISVIPAQSSVQFVWSTNVATRYIVRWGRTDAYELGSVYGGELKREHNTTITELEVATKYYYELEAISGYGVKKIIARGNFTTKGSIPLGSMPNVSHISLSVAYDSVQLDWQNPAVVDFAYVRILRSHLFYPQHPTDGTLVYEGAGVSYFDKEVLSERSPQYYTIFVYGKNGQISSGAVAVAVRQIPPEMVTDSEILPIGNESKSTTTDLNRSSVIDLWAMNISLTQSSGSSYLHQPKSLQALEPTFISILVTAVPAHLKSIIVSVTQPGQEKMVSSYLLKINPAGTAYETYLPAPLATGKSTLTVQLYDYELAVVRTISNTIEFTMVPDKTDWLQILQVIIISVVGLSLGLISWLFFLTRRRV